MSLELFITEELMEAYGEPEDSQKLQELVNGIRDEISLQIAYCLPERVDTHKLSHLSTYKSSQMNLDRGWNQAILQTEQALKQKGLL